MISGAATKLKGAMLIVVCHVAVFTYGRAEGRGRATGPDGPQTGDKAASVGYVTPGTLIEMTRPMWNADTDTWRNRRKFSRLKAVHL